MKLLLCGLCADVISLQEEKRTCKCKHVGGRYLDAINAIYFGANAKPIGFANNSFYAAALNQPQSGMGKEFTAFVVPKECDSFRKVKEEEV